MAVSVRFGVGGGVVGLRRRPAATPGALLLAPHADEPSLAVPLLLD